MHKFYACFTKTNLMKTNTKITLRIFLRCCQKKKCQKWLTEGYIYSRAQEKQEVIITYYNVDFFMTPLK